MKKYIKADISPETFEENFDNLSEADKLSFAQAYFETYEVASPEAIDLVERINGTSYETYCDILYATMGYRDFSQLGEEGGPEIIDMLGLVL